MRLQSGNYPKLWKIMAVKRPTFLTALNDAASMELTAEAVHLLTSTVEYFSISGSFLLESFLKIPINLYCAFPEMLWLLSGVT